MIVIFLLSFLEIQIPRTEINKELQIAISDNWESKLIYSELTRDWTKGGENVIGKKYNKLRKNIRFKIVFIKFDRYDITQLSEYPQYKYGKYDKWNKFDKRVFMCSSWPLRSINVLDNNYTYTDDIELYNNTTNNLMNNYWNNEYQMSRLYAWYNEIRKSSRDYKYNPKPKFSPKPQLLKFPWE